MAHIKISSTPTMINFHLLPSPTSSLSPPTSLPRPPRCLTPYPDKAHSHSPIASSPLSSPSDSPDRTPTVPSNTLSPYLSADITSNTSISPSPSPSPSASASSPMFQSKTPPASQRSVPISLRMSSLSPTDSSFPTPPPGLVSPRSPSGTRMIPLSPSAKKYMEAKHGRKERPEPIVVPFPAETRSEPRVRIVTPQSWSVLQIGGSVPLPRSPTVETPGRTAIPLTCKRIGVDSRQESGTVDVVLGSEIRGEQVLSNEPSPGWRDMV